MAVSLEIIKTGLTELGLGAGDVVLVHSDLRTLDKPRELVKFSNCGADLIIDAFIETVGAEGLVIVPTLSKSLDVGGPEKSGVYDPATSPSR
ncbi:hypothetical protein LCGC14_2642060, partial [marine sediment metagenome]